MSASPPYEKQVHYLFTAYKEEWAITIIGADGDCVLGEETRKNGQEDCHMSFEANLIDGKWVLDEPSRSCILSYSYGREIPAIEAYFNEHGMPDDNGGV